jgi:Na+/glutamate symporter
MGMKLNSKGFNSEPWYTYFLIVVSVVSGLVFLFLKTNGLIAWSWFLVLLPFYWFPALCIVFMAIAFAGIGLADAYREIEKAAKHGKIDGRTTQKDTRENT